MDPPPKVNFVPFGAGIHEFFKPEPGLPLGIAPAVAQLWYDAIMGGYYQTADRCQRKSQIPNSKFKT